MSKIINGITLPRQSVLTFKLNSIVEKLALIVTLLLGAVYMLGVSEIMKLLIGVVFLGIMLIVPKRTSIRYLMFILPANEMINIGTTSLTMIFVALFTIVYCLLSLKSTRISGGLFLGISLLMVSCFGQYVINSESVAMVSTIKHIFFLYYLAILLNETHSNLEKIYIDAFRYAAVGMLYFSLLFIGINGMPSLITRFTFSNEVTINFIAIVCVLVVVNLFYIGFAMHKSSGFDIVLMVGCSFVGILTQSRTFILGVAIGFTLFFFFSSSWIKKLKFLVIICVCFALIALVVSNVPLLSERIDAVFGRILNPSGNDVSNGRYELWAITIQTMMDNLGYFWFGAGDFLNIGAAFDNKVMVAHNLFLETWVIYGTLGCVVLLYTYIVYFKRYILRKQNGRLRLISLIPLIVMIGCLFYSHHFIGRSMSIVFGLSFLPIVLNTQSNKGE
ncbi:MAG: O-antigen ligase family protein [Clostridia bacterium]|nr:O-antigen ligase family protein [Clostridia bacterium]